MLLRFGVTNHRSLRDRQEISLVASSFGDNADGLIVCRHAPGGKLLPTVVVYGANASGKSNLVSAMRWMRSIVLYSHSHGKPDGDIPRHTFALNPSFKDAPSQFDIDFVVSDVRYHYGFELTDKIFTSEWLFAFPNERRQVLFERKGTQFHFGRHLKGRNQIISELMRPNSLFLSAASQNGHEELTKLSKYFQGIAADETPRHWLAKKLSERPADDRISKFLDAVGTGIVDYRTQITDARPEIAAVISSLSKLSEVIVSIDDSTTGYYRGADNDYKTPSDQNGIQLKLGHKIAGGEAIYFDIFQESEGTQRLLGLLAPIFHALDTGGLMVVDELDASLHTHACEMLLALFSSPATNPKGAQLIATTHDTNLLASRHLRRDQVWLTEKDAEGATHLYPLTDFRTRKNDNLARGYLQGRYGAVPFSGRLPDILAES